MIAGGASTPKWPRQRPLKGRNVQPLREAKRGTNETTQPIKTRPRPRGGAPAGGDGRGRGCERSERQPTMLWGETKRQPRNNPARAKRARPHCRGAERQTRLTGGGNAEPRAERSEGSGEEPERRSPEGATSTGDGKEQGHRPRDYERSEPQTRKAGKKPTPAEDAQPAHPRAGARGPRRRSHDGRGNVLQTDNRTRNYKGDGRQAANEQTQSAVARYRQNRRSDLRAGGNPRRDQMATTLRASAKAEPTSRAKHHAGAEKQGAGGTEWSRRRNGVRPATY